MGVSWTSLGKFAAHGARMRLAPHARIEEVQALLQAAAARGVARQMGQLVQPLPRDTRLAEVRPRCSRGAAEVWPGVAESSRE